MPCKLRCHYSSNMHALFTLALTPKVTPGEYYIFPASLGIEAIKKGFKFNSNCFLLPDEQLVDNIKTHDDFNKATKELLKKIPNIILNIPTNLPQPHNVSQAYEESAELTEDAAQTTFWDAAQSFAKGAARTALERSFKYFITLAKINARAQANRAQANRAQANREQANREQANREQANREQANREQANREQAKKSSEMERPEAKPAAHGIVPFTLDFVADVLTETFNLPHKSIPAGSVKDTATTTFKIELRKKMLGLDCYTYEIQDANKVAWKFFIKKNDISFEVPKGTQELQSGVAIMAKLLKEFCKQKQLPKPYAVILYHPNKDTLALMQHECKKIGLKVVDCCTNKQDYEAKKALYNEPRPVIDAEAAPVGGPLPDVDRKKRGFVRT